VKFLYPGGGVNTAYGIMAGPNQRAAAIDIINGKSWAGDLGCLQGPAYVKKINFSAVAEWLPKMAIYRDKCIFLAGFDVVFDAQATLDAYEEYQDYFPGWPLAYVAQNGAESLPIPATCAAVFIGGDTAWKEGYEAVTVIQRAQAMGKRIHIGRVNWWRRYELFRALPGSESFTCDGNRQKYDGREKAVAAWMEYQERRAIRQLALPAC